MVLLGCLLGQAGCASLRRRSEYFELRGALVAVDAQSVTIRHKTGQVGVFRVPAALQPACDVPLPQVATGTRVRAIAKGDDPQRNAIAVTCFGRHARVAKREVRR